MGDERRAATGRKSGRGEEEVKEETKKTKEGELGI